MKTLLSGLDEDTCHQIVGSSLQAGQSMRWCAPDKLLQLLADEAGSQPPGRVVWFYRSPAAIVDATPAERASDLHAELRLWLEQNRTVLNLRRRLGRTLLLVNADNVSPADLHAELGEAGVNAAPGASEHTASPTVGGDDRDPGRQNVVQHLFEWIAPRYCEVFESLEAASWLPKSEPVFRNTVTPGEVHLVAMLETLCNGSALPGLLAQARQLERTRTLELASAKEQIEALRQVADSAAGDCEELRRSNDWLRQESQDRLLELHQVQEELEQYYLKSVDLAKLLDPEGKSGVELQGKDHLVARLREAHGALKQEKEHLLIQLHQVQEELEQYYRKNVELPVVTREAPYEDAKRNNEGGAGRQKPALAARLLPGRIRARLERSKARKVRQARLDLIGESEWFNRQWYLDTHADVGSAEMDPVEHYFDFGWKEGRNPSAIFDTLFYLESNPDVASSGLNPLWHFIAYGLKEGRLPRKP